MVLNTKHKTVLKNHYVFHQSRAQPNKAEQKQSETT
jgi:hypothetical protein